MDKEYLFENLKIQNNAVLIELLDTAYDEMNTSQRNEVFSELIEKFPPPIVDPEELLDDIAVFCELSSSGHYYEPFDINSKSFSDIPEETEAWFEELGDYLKLSTLLSQQGKHSVAIECFALLYEIIDQMERGEEIVFADEVGTWMIPIDEKPCFQAYIFSSAVLLTPEKFADAVMPLLWRDSIESFSNEIYSIIKIYANKEQKNYIDNKSKQQGIRIKPN